MAVCTPLENVLGRLDGYKKTGKRQYMAKCPGHDDLNPSLSIGVGDDGRVLLNCHAGCSLQQILDAIGLTESDLFERDYTSDASNQLPVLAGANLLADKLVGNEPTAKPAKKKQQVKWDDPAAIYKYLNADGSLAYGKSSTDIRTAMPRIKRSRYSQESTSLSWAVLEPSLTRSIAVIFRI